MPVLPTNDPRCLLWERAAEFSWVFDRSLHLHYASRSFPENPQELLGPGWRKRVEPLFSGRIQLLREVARGPNGTCYSLAHFPLATADTQIRFAGGLAQSITPSDLEHSLSPDPAQTARFLHDDVAQNLSTAGLQLDLLRMDGESVIPGLAGRTFAVQSLLETVMDRLRKLGEHMQGVGPGGLPAALERLAALARNRFSGEVSVRAATGVPLSPEIAAGLYRIARQAVTNAIRKTSCSRIEILLKSTRYGLVLEVRSQETLFDTLSRAGASMDSGVLLLEEEAVRANLDLWVRLERRKGMLVRVLCQVRRPLG